MRVLATCLLLLLAMLPGCFGDDGGSDGGDPGDGDPDGDMPGDDPDDEPDEEPDDDPDEGNQTPPDDNETPEPRDPVTWEIVVSGNRFVDGTITVQQGDTVNWVHEDGTTPHTVTADDESFHSGDCPGTDCMTELANSEWPHTFNDVGEHPYHCQVHPSMTGTITVLEVYLEEP